jgi:hypothetical protein
MKKIPRLLTASVLLCSVILVVSRCAGNDKSEVKIRSDGFSTKHCISKLS